MPTDAPVEKTKEDLEKVKLQIEINLLKRRWFRKPEWWPPIAAIVVIIGGLLAGFLSKENLIQQISKLNVIKDSLLSNNKRGYDSLQTISFYYQKLKSDSAELTRDTAILHERLFVLSEALRVKDNNLSKNKFLEETINKYNDVLDQNRNLSAKIDVYEHSRLFATTPISLAAAPSSLFPGQLNSALFPGQPVLLTTSQQSDISRNMQLYGLGTLDSPYTLGNHPTFTIPSSTNQSAANWFDSLMKKK